MVNVTDMSKIMEQQTSARGGGNNQQQDVEVVNEEGLPTSYGTMKLIAEQPGAMAASAANATVDFVRTMPSLLSPWSLKSGNRGMSWMPSNT